MTESDQPSVAQRLLRYVRIYTQSCEGSETSPSTPEQLDLLQLLVDELRALGVEDARMDDAHYALGTLASNVEHDVPVIGLFAHVDTSPELTGKDVKPRIHPNYQGGPIALDERYTLTPEQSPELAMHVGHTIITTDGSTLLGADNKAGIAEIMTLVERLRSNPEIPHGKIRIAFTYDEEIGRGTERFDLAAFGADVGYTVDGETVGEIQDETFCGDAAVVTFTGVNVHPGYAKDKLVNATKAAARFIDKLPADQAPESTDGRDGYLHPVAISGGVEQAEVRLILRDFDLEPLAARHRLLEQIAAQVEQEIPGVEVVCRFEETYRNMRFILDDHPQVVENAMEAVRRAGIEPTLSPIRGGTDGAHLSYAGLPTPNIFTGAHLFHSRFEWVAVEGMQAAVDTLEHLVRIYAERARG